MTTPTDWNKHWLAEALVMAQIALDDGFAPVGAVLVDRDNHLIAADMAATKPSGDADKSSVSILHAELYLLIKNQEKLGRGKPMTLYVSLEPCHMCMGAAIVARIGRVVWALDDYWGGATKLYDSGRAYLQARMPELVRTPYPDLQARAAQMWVAHLNQYNLPDYIERMLRWQARLEES